MGFFFSFFFFLLIRRKKSEGESVGTAGEGKARPQGAFSDGFESLVGGTFYSSLEGVDRDPSRDGGLRNKPGKPEECRAEPLSRALCQGFIEVCGTIWVPVVHLCHLVFFIVKFENCQRCGGDPNTSIW